MDVEIASKGGQAHNGSDVEDRELAWGVGMRSVILALRIEIGANETSG